MNPRQTRVFGISLSVIAALIIVAWLFTPLFGRAVWGPMQMGPMSFGMMREMRNVSDVENEFQYLTRMIPHHQEAVDTARTLRERTDRPEMRAFAESIIETQTREIEQMEEWLSRWYPDRSEEAGEVDYEPMMRDYSSRSGDRLDRAFLEDMIPHHMAAVMMSQRLLSGNYAEHPEVEELADAIRDAQLREIRQMSNWLDRWFN